MAGTATLMALKANSEARSAEDRAAADRHRGVLVLILDHLVATGYTETSAALEREGGAPLSRFAAADNVDLATIVREFETFYEMKLGKKPKLVRKVEGNNESCDGKGRNGTDRRRGRPLGAPPPSSNNASNNSNNNAGRHGADTAPGSVRDSAEGSVRLKADGLTAEQRDKYAAAAAAAGVQSQQLQGVQSKLGTSAAFGGSSDRFGENSHHVDSSGNNGSGGAAKPDLDFGLTGTSVSKANNHRNGNSSGKAGDESLEDRLLKPLPFAGDPELRALGQTISRDIFQSNPEVSWDDVVSLESAKRLLKEAVVMPVKYPQLFTGLLSPWMGILLYGPPGTGKTMLAKAVATECKTTFFNISASSIVSKYRGDSEKLVRVLFELARYHAPSTIFLDEIDSIMGQRGGGESGGEHEGSRRMKTELLIQMDGLAKTDALVFVLAASNIPWELDTALLRRLEKRVLVPLPDEHARLAMLEKLLLGAVQPRKQQPELASEEQSTLTTESPPLLLPQPPLQGAAGGGAPPHPIDTLGVDLAGTARATQGFSGSDVRLLCKEAAMKPVRRMMAKLEALDADPSRHGRSASDAEIAAERAKDPISATDLAEALQATRPSAQRFEQRYLDWQRDFGAV